MCILQPEFLKTPGRKFNFCVFQILKVKSKLCVPHDDKFLDNLQINMEHAAKQITKPNIVLPYHTQNLYMKNCMPKKKVLQLLPGVESIKLVLHRGVMIQRIYNTICIMNSFQYYYF